jgi:translation elongation factor EF-1beta
MTPEKLTHLLKMNTTVKMVTADNAPLIIGFLFKSFKQEQHNSISNSLTERELTSNLTDYLYVLNQDDVLYPRKSKEYLTDWTNAGYLRKYPGRNDEFLFELTPAAENAFKWIDSLERPEFVGTESRLKNLFEKIKELSVKTKVDKKVRLKELNARKQAIEDEINDLNNGKIDILDDRQIKEQYLMIEETAKYLLADFRQIEDNFRNLDRNFRKKIITTSQTKGKVLDDFWQQQDFLLETDQGKSFTAFWEFLLLQSRQDELDELINDILNIPAVQQLQKETFRLENIRNNLVEAGDKTKKTTNSLWEQLRKFLEHKSFFENRIIHENITKIFKTISENANVDFSTTLSLNLDDIIKIDLITEKPLFKVPQRTKFSQNEFDFGETTSDYQNVFEQFEIDIGELRNNIKNALKHKTQISFSDFIKEFPIQKGVAEVVAYLEMATQEKHKHIVDEEVRQFIDVQNIKTDKLFKIEIPQIIFCK